jgi:hydroxyethylthiazole kinase-like uncharacterized protein yjeF
MAPLPIDLDWRNAHPLPVHDAGEDKNGRGRVLIVGGSELVPGALRLSGEAALRAGAGKLRMATVMAAAMALGVHLPEAAVIALPANEDGDIAEDAAGRLAANIDGCDTMIVGPGMHARDHVAALVASLLSRPRGDLSVLLDAAAISCAGELTEVIGAHGGRVVMTPHYGEMAALTGLSEEEVAARPLSVALDVARRYGSLVVLKSAETVIAAPDGETLLYGSDCVGLATGGSGDVLAGVIGGLLARGAPPLVAAGWGVWLHGEVGRRAAMRIGRLGFIARDLLLEIPGLMNGNS